MPIIPPLCNQHYRNGMEFIVLHHLFQLKDKGYNPDNIKIRYLRTHVLVIVTSPTLGTDQKPFVYPLGKYDYQSGLP